MTKGQGTDKISSFQRGSLTYIEVFFFSYCLIFSTITGVNLKKKKFARLRTSLYRGSTENIHYVHINSIFVGIRIFQHLYLSLSVSIPELTCSKLQNAYLYKTALSPRLLRFQTARL